MIKPYLPLFTVLTSFSLLLSSPSSPASVLDDFNDNVKTDWQDFTFLPNNIGVPVEANQQFTISLPPIQPIFSGSRKTSQEFELRNGRTVEFRVDLVDGNGPDAFAVLAFIPTANPLSSLAGYGFAKSTTDILLTKGIGKYFYNENAPVKNNNVTLVLTLSAKDGTVTIHGQVLDKDNANAVIWEQTAVDTPGEDVLSDGTDSPAAPYLTRGHFSLLCYEDYSASNPQAVYQVIYDNAETCVLDDTIVDDFDDNTKTGWSDFTFLPNNIGVPVEANQQFTFSLPPIQPLFSGSRKTTRVFDLRECGHLQFRVDLVDGNGPDAFAVLAMIPEANPLSSLAGYGLAKSTTDILLTKGIGKYFYNENVQPPVKNNNVILVLDLTITNTDSVVIKGQVLDKDNNNAVIWQQVVIDTPGEDVLADGTDSPAAPYYGGQFTLFLYEDYSASNPQAVYQVIYDNAAVLAPALAANQPPQISDVTPNESANFLPANTTITFHAADDNPLVNTGISIRLNGTLYTTANGLVVTGTGNSRDVSLGGLAADQDYTAELQVVDSNNATNKALLHFDTFNPENITIEVEDYNYGVNGAGGGFYDNPIPAPEGSGPGFGSYNNQAGIPDVDFHDTRTSPNGQDTRYRTSDPVRMRHTLDIARQKYIDAGGAAQNVYDYDVVDIAAGEWLNYTRFVPSGSYHVYLRQSIVNLAQSESVLERVTNDPSLPLQETVPLGSFLGRLSGFQFRNVPLTDALGNLVIVRLADIMTFRLSQTSQPGDGLIAQNYLIFVSTADPGLQRCHVTSVTPADGSSPTTVTPVLSATIQNLDTSVDESSIVLQLNGQTVAATVASTANGATTSFDIAPLPAPGVLNHARVIFADNLHVSQTNDWSFTLQYHGLNPANKLTGAGGDRGLLVRMVQSPPGTATDNSLARAEGQLAIPPAYPIVMDTNTVLDVINMNKIQGASAGVFPNDSLVPGLYDSGGVSLGNGVDDFTVETVAYLDLAAGVYTFGAITDDGYKCSSGATLHDTSTAGNLGFHNGGPANETFDFVVREAGLYPFRFLWYERGGSGYGEWFSVNRSTGDRTLINDPSSQNSIKAYVAVTQVTLQSSLEVTGPFTDDASAVLDLAQSKFTLPASGERRFYRVKAPTPQKIDIQVSGGNVTIHFAPAP
jgi:hypothetical protein